MTTGLLTASRAGPLIGQVTVPGDKSISHRAIILGGLASGETHIEGLLESLDVMATVSAVRAFGAEVEQRAPGSWRVQGCRWHSPAEPIDCGNSGTSARLLMGAAAGFPIDVTYTGDESLKRRPMDRVLEPLCAMGAQLMSSDSGRLPLRLRGGGLRGLSYRSKVASAQVKSAVLFAGLHAAGEVHYTEPAVSRDHSERMLTAFGCDIDVTGGTVRLGQKRTLTGTRVQVPGDPSSAAYPLVASLLLPGSDIHLKSVLIHPLRNGLVETLIEMGADLKIANQTGEIADLQAHCSALSGVDVPAGRAPSMIDDYPALAVAAAFAKGRTVLRGLSELRIKECDRLEAIHSGLLACGVECWIEGDDLFIEGQNGPPRGGARVSAHGDHRIAMSFIVFGLASEEPVTVDSAKAIPTSFPSFTRLMGDLGANIR